MTVADHVRDDSMAVIARRILAEAPPRFALAGHSMGGYIAFEICGRRRSGSRSWRWSTARRAGYAGGERAPPRPDRPDQGRRVSRRARRAVSRLRASVAATTLSLRRLVHDMGDDIGAEGFVRQLTAIIGRPDSRPTLACDPVPDAGVDQRRGQHHAE